MIKIREEIKKYLEANNNKNTAIQILWHAAKAILGGKFTQAFFKKLEKYQKNNLIHHLKELEKEQTKPTFSRRKEITKIREEINKIEIKKIHKKINKTKNSFFERVNRISKPLARLIGKTDDPNEIKNERGEIIRYCRENNKKRENEKL